MKLEALTKRYGKSAARSLDLWVKLARAYSTFQKKADANIREFGLTGPQFGALECLGHLGPMTTGTLCKKMLVSAGNLTVVLDNLEKQGLIERLPDPQDRRAIVVQLSAKGERLFEAIFVRHAKFVEGLAAALTPGEQTTLAGLLKKLGVHLAEKS